MNEFFVEQIVKWTPTKKDRLVKIMLILLCVISLVMLFLPFGFLVVLGVIIFTVFVLRDYDREYEYSFVDGELDVDKIICKSSRKKCGSFDFRRLEMMAPLGSQSDMRYSHKKYREYDYSSGDTEHEKYVAYVMKENETVRLVFEPNEEMIRAINYIAKGKVFND